MAASMVLPAPLNLELMVENNRVLNNSYGDLMVINGDLWDVMVI